MDTKRTRKTERLKTYKSRIRFIVLVCCTVIAGYGIVSAPESDQKELERGLQKNAEALQSTKTASAMQNHSPSPCIESASPHTPDAADKQGEPELISVIGDSVFLGAAPSFQKRYPNTVIDAKISRQVRHALSVAKEMKKKNQLGKIVIISLGTNGNFNPATGQELIDYLGTDRTIYWINAYEKRQKDYKKTNRTIAEMVKKNSNVQLIDWASEGKKHPKWFYQDGTHLNEKGQEGFARFIQKELEK